MAKVINTTFQLKRATADRWNEVNPILALAEPGFERDTGKLKIGDGERSWKELDYIGDEVSHYLGIEDLPDPGKLNHLYHVDKFLYQWNGSAYEKIGGATEEELAQIEQVITLIQNSIKELEKSTKKIIASTITKKFEISDTPIGTLVNYGEDEIRIMCPEGTEWKLQNVGANGNPNIYYMTFKAYAPDNAVYFKEGDRGTIVDEEFDFNGSASGIDKHGRKYSVCWLALASFDGTNWTYYGKNSTTKKYIGWTYVVEWYDENRNKIGFDTVRINLSNESCHYNIEPYYMNNINVNSLTQNAGEVLELYGGSATDNIKLEG